jgi:hypothetical protein
MHQANIQGGGKIVHVVFKYSICPEVCCRKGCGRAEFASPYSLPPFFPVDISFKDDVTVILLLYVSFMVKWLEK